MYDNTALNHHEKPLRVAIVEDNATARTNLRSHLMSIDNYEISSFSTGKELKASLKLNNIDMVLVDFHLGVSMTGVEWIIQLREEKLIKENTSLIFVTSDGTPQAVGKMLDLHPDFILIKPYTIKTLRLNLKHALSLRHETLEILSYMTQNNNQLALSLLDQKFDNPQLKRFKNDFLKLKGRLLLKEKQYDEASELYSGILKKSTSVLWAHWGLIKSEFFTGKWSQCHKQLNHLLSESLSKEKAYEWMASISIGKGDYKSAETILDNIKDSDLTFCTTRLKVFCYRLQNKHKAAMSLLEKKIQSNLSVNDRMAQYATELARYHIFLAENLVEEIDHLSGRNKDKAINKQAIDKSNNLAEAKRLISKTNRASFEKTQEVQKDYLNALVYLLEDDIEKAKSILSQTTPVELLQNPSLSSLLDAVKIWFGLGEEEKAKQLLESCDEVILNSESQIDRIISGNTITQIEETHQIQKDRALQTNDRGMRYYLNDDFQLALQCFYQAHKSMPGVPAFSLNLLQCMADIKQYEYQGLEAEVLYNDLLSITLNQKNLNRLKQIKIKLGLV